MAESVITVSLITIACVICATMLIAAIYPAMNRASSSVTATTDQLGDRIETSIEIIEKAKDSSDSSKCYVWVKNIGSSRIAKIDTSDIFFGETGAFQRLTYSDPLSGKSWNYDIMGGDGDDRWDPKETLRITIENVDTINAGEGHEYFVKLTLYNGESAEGVFSFSE
jgi:archaellum component FlaF (FlaF/FlaG flagellin family)